MLARELELAVVDRRLPAPERIANLKVIRRDITDLLGLAERYLSDAEKEYEAEVYVARAAEMRAEMQARTNATLREQVLARGLATPEQMDESGFLSHEALDALERRHGRLHLAIQRDPVLADAVRPSLDNGRSGADEQRDGSARLTAQPENKDSFGEGSRQSRRPSRRRRDVRR